jgi:hypothetical protein
MNIGENIKKIRKSKGLTQKELADKMGITQQSFAQYERTQNIPKLETLRTIAAALDVSIYDLQGVSWMNKAAELNRTHKEKTQVLLDHYNKLNDLGQDKAIERVEELTELKKYTDKD